MAFLLGVAVMALGVALSIALHEIGHMVPAKKFGVRVPQYMVGFGPTIFSRTRGETEYGLKAIPLGGYVRMIGMFPPRPGDDPTLMRGSSTGRIRQLVDEARSQNEEEMQPGDENRVFYRLSVPKKITIMMGGPTMNLLIGVVLMTGLVTLFGVATPQPGAHVETVSECVVPVTQASETTSCEGHPRTPALAAGIQPDDLIVAIDGKPIERASDVSTLIRPRVGQPTELRVLRGEETLELTATPIRNSLPVYDEETGQPVMGEDGGYVMTEAGFLGIRSSSPLEYERQPLSAVPGILGAGLAGTLDGVAHIPARMGGVWNAAFAGGQREVDSPMSVVGAGRVAGDVTAGRYDALVGETAPDRVAFLVSLIAGLNFVLFIFNLIPLLPLDGGHVAGAAWEGLKRTYARLTDRPDPGPVDVSKALPLAYAVGAILLSASALLIYADIVNPINLGG